MLTQLTLSSHSLLYMPAILTAWRETFFFFATSWVEQIAVINLAIKLSSPFFHMAVKVVLLYLAVSLISIYLKMWN